MKEEQHTTKCATNTHKYFGDRRNAPDGNEMMPCDCDGYHTFDELYDHRITLYIALCNYIARDAGYGYVWRSKKHSDGKSYEGWFLLGIEEKNGKQITYHIPNERWDELDSISVQTRGIAPEFDGHTSADVLERLKKL